MLFQATTATKRIVKLKNRIRAVQGGSSASKTISILLYLINKAQTDKTPTITSIVSESMPHLKKGAIRDFKNIMQGHKYWRDSRWNVQDSTYTFETNSKLEFFSADSGDKLRGARRDRLFINEANNVTLEAFNQLEIRTKDFVFIDWNPTYEFWFYDDVINRDDLDHIILTYKDNESLDENIIKALEQRKANKNWWRVYGLGLLGELEDKIYKGWEIIDTIPHAARLVRYGLDFGYTNDPTAVIGVYMYNGGYIFDEVCYQTGMMNNQIADVFKFIDKQLIIADSAEPKSIDEIRIHGLNIIPSKKGQGSVNYGIDFIRGQKCSMTKRSTNLIKEYRNYMWQTDREGKTLNQPIDSFNHGLDAIRYALSDKISLIKNDFTTKRNSIRI